MRRVIFESSVSLDGFIEGPNGELDWLAHDEEGPLNPGDFLASFDTIFYGRKAYERFGVPSCTSDARPDEREFYYMLYGMRKYVFSRQQKHVAGNAMVVSDGLEREVKRIREEDGKDIWLCGGAEILRTFASLDLVDEYILTVHPVMLHGGKALFAGNQKPLNLKLIGKRDLKSGIVILHYKPENRLKK